MSEPVFSWVEDVRTDICLVLDFSLKRTEFMSW